MSVEEPIGLAEAIEQVRAELATAQRAGASQDLQFRLGEVQLEFSVELAREGGGEAGVKLWVVNVGTKGTVTSTRGHTVTVTMLPQSLGPDGEWQDLRVGDRSGVRPPASAGSGS